MAKKLFCLLALSFLSTNTDPLLYTIPKTGMRDISILAIVLLGPGMKGVNTGTSNMEL